ncbi:MAG: hypothetical protein HYU02_02355 [Thaumarchaeota archaeon]|nr:hypothetical protein [Nitrososphaerota archaeon]
MGHHEGRSDVKDRSFVFHKAPLNTKTILGTIFSEDFKAALKKEIQKQNCMLYLHLFLPGGAVFMIDKDGRVFPVEGGEFREDEARELSRLIIPAIYKIRQFLYDKANKTSI